MFTRMVSMAKSPEEMKEDMADMPAPVAANKISGPKYPYGLCISLDDETLEKLGLEGDLPAVGETMHFEAIARVTCASANESEGMDGATRMCRRVELQITDMGVPDPDPAGRAEEASAARRKRFYPNMVEDNDNDGE